VVGQLKTLASSDRAAYQSGTDSKVKSALTKERQGVL
jgi:hypothetical protein